MEDLFQAAMSEHPLEIIEGQQKEENHPENVPISNTYLREAPFDTTVSSPLMDTTNKAMADNTKTGDDDASEDDSSESSSAVSSEEEDHHEQQQEQQQLEETLDTSLQEQPLGFSAPNDHESIEERNDHEDMEISELENANPEEAKEQPTAENDKLDDESEDSDDDDDVDDTPSSPPPPPPPPPPPEPKEEMARHEEEGEEEEKEGEEQASSPTDLPSKRPSPWRQPRVNAKLPPPVRTASDEELDNREQHLSAKSKKLAAKKSKRRSKRKLENLYHKLFQDSIRVEIPLSVTADLAVPIQRTREKRVATIYKHFPALKPEKADRKATEDNDENDTSAAEDENGKKEDGDLTAEEASASGGPGRKKRKPLPKLKNVPRAQDYASVLDYLEAKYVQGVMIDDEADIMNDSDHEDGGSVYSETSFLDDSGLQRTVAEQVLGHATTTKMELEDDDDAFFVNVGDLEVEETELTQEKYDPLQDSQKDKSFKRKRKKVEGKDVKDKNLKDKNEKDKNEKDKNEKAKNLKDKNLKDKNLKEKTEKEKNVKDKKGPDVVKKKKLLKEKEKEVKKKGKDVKETTPIKKKKKNMEEESSSVSQPKKKKPKLSDETETSKKSNKSSDTKKKKPKKPLSEKAKLLQKKSRIRKKKMETAYKKVVEYIENEATPEEWPRRKTKTRVALQCPPDKKTGDMITFTNPHVPGQKLKVKIPSNRSANGNFKVTVPVPPESKDDENVKDHNKITRKFYDLLEEYGRFYDEWCDNEETLRKEMGQDDYFAHTEKRKKFDELPSVFPKDMKTPVDRAYLQKVLRRAKQNKHKREQTLALRQKAEKSEGEKSDADDESQASTVKKAAAKKKKPAAPATVSIIVPQLATVFPKRKFLAKNF